MFHWSLTGFFIIAYVLGNEWPALHSHAGYTILLLVMFRLIWGFWGTEYARFAQFVPIIFTLKTYIIQLLRGKSEHFMGHNPAGSAMTVALLTSLVITGISGTMLFAMEGQGPLANTPVALWNDRWTVDIHHLFSDLTLGLICVHVIGVLMTIILKRENLILAMITGKKSREDSES